MAQSPAAPGTIAGPPTVTPLAGSELPSFSSIKQESQPVPETRSRSGFLKDLTIQSFGYSLAPTGLGFEFSPALSSGPFTSYGLECPRCVIRPPIDRIRYTLPPFGAEATLKLWDDHVEFFAGLGGVNAWRADNITIETGALSFRRVSSFNDAWLQQSWVGSRIAADRGRRLWFGAAGRHVENFGADGLKRWNTFSGNATFVFGH